MWESTLVGFEESLAASASSVWQSAQQGVARALREGRPRSWMRSAKSADDRVSASSVRCASASGRVVPTRVAWFRFEGDLLLGHDHEETARLVGEVMAWHGAKSIVFWARQGSEPLFAYEPAPRVSLAALPERLGECGPWLVVGS